MSFLIYRDFIKPFFDRLVALMLLVITFPVWLIILIFQFFIYKTQLFFFQTRPGYESKPFVIFKFRTMIGDYQAGTDNSLDAQRLTWFGKFLRKTSLDELPQLINILRGEMSLVGPRPLLMEYMSIYNSEQSRRHDVKPGITGWAQVNGRNAITWKDKLSLDIWYVDHQSFLLDLKILFLTLIKVLGAQGVNAPGSATTEKFNGQN